jgi:hypothetical protein
MYFVLALLDTLLHTVDVFSISLSAFKALDITIGTAIPCHSQLRPRSHPSLVYRCTLRGSYPLVHIVLGPFSRFRISRYLHRQHSMDLQIYPLCLYTSHCGLQCCRVFPQPGLWYVYHLYQNRGVAHHDTKAQHVRISPENIVVPIAVRYKVEGLQTFFNSLVLIILIIFHAGVFLLCSSRLVKAIYEKTRIEIARDAANEAAFINGLGWTALGIKLGFVEAIVGFFGDSFCTITIRRGLRFLSRACLIIGDVKG